MARRERIKRLWHEEAKSPVRSSVRGPGFPLSVFVGLHRRGRRRKMKMGKERAHMKHKCQINERLKQARLDYQKRESVNAWTGPARKEEKRNKRSQA